MQEPSTWFVCLMGVGTVFVGLVCIVVICYLLSFISRKALKDNTAPESASTAETEQLSGENRQEMIAAISAAIAEASGKEMSAIRILSVKKL